MESSVVSRHSWVVLSNTGGAPSVGRPSSIVELGGTPDQPSAPLAYGCRAALYCASTSSSGRLALQRAGMDSFVAL